MRRRYQAEVAPFVVDIALFDAALRAHGGIISGTAALHFFHPDAAWNARELDIYLPSNTYRSFLRTISSAHDFGWTHIPGFRLKQHSLSRYSSVFRFIGGGVDETEYTVDEYLDPAEADKYLSPSHRRCPQCGREHSIPYHSTTHPTTPDCDSDNGDSDELDDDLSSDTDEGDSHFLHSDDDNLTDGYVQLEFYSPELPSLAHGKGFSTMRSYRTPTGKRVNIVRSHSINPVSPLRHFFTTFMANFITPDHCVCAFPTATLRRRGAPRVEPLCMREEAALHVYETRGFLTHEDFRDQLDLWEYIFFGERTLLAITFRQAVSANDTHILPIACTPRGWVVPDNWLVEPPRNSELYLSTTNAH